MAIWKTGNGDGNYFNEDAKELVAAYIMHPDKAIHGYTGGYGVDPYFPAESMKIVSEQFGKQQGVQLRHFVVSFAPDELNDPDIVNVIAQQFAMYVGQRYQALYAVHENKSHLHFHLMHNSVSYLDGRRCYGKRPEFHDYQRVLKGILAQYGIYRLTYVSNKRKEQSPE